MAISSSNCMLGTMISFDSSHLRLLWNTVESHRHDLQHLSDDAVCVWLLKKIADSLYLNQDEMGEIETYILSRSHLIREVANS